MSEESLGRIMTSFFFFVTPQHTGGHASSSSPLVPYLTQPVFSAFNRLECLGRIIPEKDFFSFFHRPSIFLPLPHCPAFLTQLVFAAFRRTNKSDITNNKVWRTTAYLLSSALFTTITVNIFKAIEKKKLMSADFL